MFQADIYQNAPENSETDLKQKVLGAPAHGGYEAGIGIK